VDLVCGVCIDVLRNNSTLKGSFQYNLFTHDIEHARDNTYFSPTAKKNETITDTDVHLLRAYLTKRLNFSPAKDNINTAIIDVSMDIRYHPIKQYLEGLRWDGISRLDTFLIDICGVEDNEYTRSVSRKVFVALIKRIYEPGCQFDYLTILEGQQGIYKSRLLRAIGGKWYAPIELLVNDRKSLADSMRGKWLLEVEELAGFKKADVERMKSFLSCPVDRIRFSYGERSEDFKRQCVLIGTMNPDGENKYLNDVENRRFWPIELPNDKKIKLDLFCEHRDQYFAEACLKYNDGELLYLDNDEAARIALEEQNKRRSIDPWEGIVELWVIDKEKAGETRFTINEISIKCLNIPSERVNSGITRRIAKILNELGFSRVRTTTGDKKYHYQRLPYQEKEWCA